MSIESMALVLHHSRAKGTDKLILLGIANHAGDGGAFPSKATLGRYANCDASTVKRSLARLVESGEVERDLQAGWPGRAMNDWHRPNAYRVLVECPEGCRGNTNHDPLPGWERWSDGTYAPVDNSDEDRGAQTRPGGVDAPRAGRADAPLTVPLTDDANSGSASTTDRTREDRPCAECGAPSEAACVEQQRRWPVEDRHEYRATQRRAK